MVVTSLTFSALMYLIARQGALYRFRDHTRVPRAEVDRHFPADYDHGVTVLVPSYVEELQVVRKTLWSAALQEFPDLRLVLLIDDPPYPTDPQRLAELAVTREIPAEIEQALAPIAARFATFAAPARPDVWTGVTTSPPTTSGCSPRSTRLRPRGWRTWPTPGPSRTTPTSSSQNRC